MEAWICFSSAFLDYLMLNLRSYSQVKKLSQSETLNAQHSAEETEIRKKKSLIAFA